MFSFCCINRFSVVVIVMGVRERVCVSEWDVYAFIGLSFTIILMNAYILYEDSGSVQCLNPFFAIYFSLFFLLGVGKRHITVYVYSCDPSHMIVHKRIRIAWFSLTRTICCFHFELVIYVRVFERTVCQAVQKYWIEIKHLFSRFDTTTGIYVFFILWIT